MGDVRRTTHNLVMSHGSMRNDGAGWSRGGRFPEAPRRPAVIVRPPGESVRAAGAGRCDME